MHSTNKSHIASSTTPSPSARSRSWWLSPKGRAALSVLIFLHLLAVIGEPMRMFSRGRQPAAPDAQVVRSGLGPYIDFAYLHHGYFFFAPNPGPSHLMDIRLMDEDGSVRHLRLPNHRAQWPRLLYHRHFMLSEFLFQLYTPRPDLADINAAVPIRQAWQRDREMFERVRDSMEQHLAKRYGAKSAEIQLMEHRLPNAIEVFDQQLPIDDEQFYIPLPDRPLLGNEADLPPDASEALPPRSDSSQARTSAQAQTQTPAPSRTPPPMQPEPEEVKP